MVTRTAIGGSVSLLPAGSVHLTDGPFHHAEQLNKHYLLRLDPSRLLAPYFREAGLDDRAAPYGNWESQGLDGHTAGHFLSAVSLVFAHTGDDRFLRLGEEVVAGLTKAQSFLGTGYVGGIPNSAQLWGDVSRGGITASTFTQDGRWAPWYNLHKTFAGLIEAHRSAHITGALEVVTRLADWWLDVAARIDDHDFELMLDIEFGGMNESFADLAGITGRTDYLEMARRFSHRAVFDPLANEMDALTGLHANTQIPKVIGYQRVAEVTGDRDYARAATFFFDTVVNRRTMSIGAHGVREHFHPSDDFHTIFEDREGPESCNSYNMVRLAGDLYLATGASEYMDYTERTLQNHVLSAQHPEHGGYVYFTSMRPGHYRVYSSAEETFWCCVGTAIEAHARHATHVFAERDGHLVVNLFINAEAEWAGMKVKQDAFVAPRFGTHITVEAGVPTRRVIEIRIPAWAEGEPRVEVNGERMDVPRSHGYLGVERTWADGDVLSVVFSASPRLERLPAASDWVSVAWGPTVYALPGAGDLPDLVAHRGRTSHIASGALAPLAVAPVVEHADGAAQGSDNGEVVLTTTHGPVTLVPFNQVHDSRYTIYFPFSQDSGERRDQLLQRDRWQVSLDARTHDVLVFGEQQPEADHALQTDDSEVGRDGENPWRRTSTSMSVTLMDWRRTATFLRVTRLDGDGNVGYDILANDVRIATVARSCADTPPIMCSDEYRLPSTFHDEDIEQIRITFRAQSGCRSDRLTELRLLSGPELDVG